MATLHISIPKPIQGIEPVHSICIVCKQMLHRANQYRRMRLFPNQNKLAFYFILAMIVIPTFSYFKCIFGKP